MYIFALLTYTHRVVILRGMCSVYGTYNTTSWLEYVRMHVWIVCSHTHNCSSIEWVIQS